MTMPKQTLASRVVIDHEAGSITVDGQEFPWHVHADGPVVERDSETPELATVSLPVLVLGDVVEVYTFEQDLEWIRAEGARQLEVAVSAFQASCQGQSVLLRHRRPGSFQDFERAMVRLGRALTDPLRGRVKGDFTLVAPR